MQMWLVQFEAWFEKQAPNCICHYCWWDVSLSTLLYQNSITFSKYSHELGFEGFG
jgi:hypothetical protein